MPDIFLILAVLFLAVCSLLFFAPKLKLLNFVNYGAGPEVVALNRYAAARLLVPFFVNLLCSYAAREKPGLMVPLLFLTPLSVLLVVIWIISGANRLKSENEAPGR